MNQVIENYLEKNPPKESDPTVPSWAKNPQKPEYTTKEVGAEEAGSAAAAVSEHNTAANTHPDIRQLIAAITVPAKVSELTNDAGYLTEHQDVSGLAEKSALSAHTENGDIHVTAAQKKAWNAKSDFSGSYNDLSDKPSLPTVPTKLYELTNDLYSTVQLEVTYEDGSTETVNMVVAV